jgi:hypothetical protein
MEERKIGVRAMGGDEVKGIGMRGMGLFSGVVTKKGRLSIR